MYCKQWCGLVSHAMPPATSSHAQVNVSSTTTVEGWQDLDGSRISGSCFWCMTADVLQQTWCSCHIRVESACRDTATGVCSRQVATATWVSYWQPAASIDTLFGYQWNVTQSMDYLCTRDQCRAAGYSAASDHSDDRNIIPAAPPRGHEDACRSRILSAIAACWKSTNDGSVWRLRATLCRSNFWSHRSLIAVSISTASTRLYQCTRRPLLYMHSHAA